MDQLQPIKERTLPLHSTSPKRLTSSILSQLLIFSRDQGDGGPKFQSYCFLSFLCRAPLQCPSKSMRRGQNPSPRTCKHAVHKNFLQNNYLSSSLFQLSASTLSHPMPAQFRPAPCNWLIPLAHTALSVTMEGAHSISTAMKAMSTRGDMSPRVAEAFSDCMDTIRDSVDELKQSMEAMGHLKGKDLRFQLHSIQTWVSAALTDDDTCMDGFVASAMNGEVKAAVRSHVVNVAQLTSNALALINALATANSSP